MDLVALNLQRGRDHGLPPYHEYRKLCGLSEIKSWRELANLVQSPEVVNFSYLVSPIASFLHICSFGRRSLEGTKVQSPPSPSPFQYTQLATTLSG